METEVAFVEGSLEVPAWPRSSRETGAVVEFHGVVREMESGSRLSALFYEAYLPMARREFARIFSELGGRHPVDAVTVIHRIGRVPVGETSLYVRITAKHRREALAFCGELIDWMKRDVPIWKCTGPSNG
jgi:molybdopterin synthase catalytic subunit